MRLYSCAFCPYSHRCRLVVKEKGMDMEIVDVDLTNKPEELSTLNPYNQVPVLVDRDVWLHEANIINEYLDDRFPHPQLMPVNISQRGRTRLMLLEYDRRLFVHANTLIKSKSQPKRDIAKKQIRENLLRLFELSPRGKMGKYLLGDEFTMLDIALAPLLWRLDHFGVRLPLSAAPMLKYAERVFSRQGFIDSLTAVERAMRK